MTAMIDEVRQRLSGLSAPDSATTERPQGHEAGERPDHAIDRMLGRSRMPIWPWIAAGIGLIAVIGLITAWFTFLRRPDEILIVERETVQPASTGYPIQEA